MERLYLARPGLLILVVFLFTLYACGGSSGGGSNAPSAGAPRVLVANSCSGASLRDKNYFLTIRNADSSDVVVNDKKLENIARTVVFEEVIVDGRPYLGITIPIPDSAPRDMPLEITVLGADGDLLPTCLAQLTHTVTRDNDNVYVTELVEIAPKVGFRTEDGDDSFGSVCNSDNQHTLHVEDNPTAQFYGSICYVGQSISLKYDVAGEALTWRSGNQTALLVSSTGLVTAIDTGPGSIDATLRNAQGAVPITVFGGGEVILPGEYPIVSMSDVALQEGNDGVEAVAFTVQLTTPDGLPLQTPISVGYALLPGSATFGNDYCLDRFCQSSDETVKPAVIIPAGALKSEPVTIFVNGDAVPESDESFFVELTPQSGTAIPDRAEITLINDDGPTSKVFAKGVGIDDGGSGAITMRSPGPGDRAFLVWNQKELKLSDIELVNEFSKLSHAVTAADLFGGQGIVAEGGPSQACFVAELPSAVLAGTGEGAVTTYTISGTKILDGAGIVVVAGLTGETFSPSFAKRLETIASFSDGQSDIVGRHVELKAGCDFFYHGAAGNENSEVVTFRVSPAQQDRDAKLTFFATDSSPARGSEVLYWADNNEVDTDNRTECPQGTFAMGCVVTLASDEMPASPALASNNGPGWDTFGQYSGAGERDTSSRRKGVAFRDPDLRGVIVIPEGATSVSVQVISPASRSGESSTLPLVALEILPADAE